MRGGESRLLGTESRRSYFFLRLAINWTRLAGHLSSVSAFQTLMSLYQAHWPPLMSSQRVRVGVIPSALPSTICWSSIVATISSPEISQTTVCQAPSFSFMRLESTSEPFVVGPVPDIFTILNWSGLRISRATCSLSSSANPIQGAPSLLKENWMTTLLSPPSLRDIAGWWPSAAISADFTASPSTTKLPLYLFHSLDHLPSSNFSSQSSSPRFTIQTLPSAFSFFLGLS